MTPRGRIGIRPDWIRQTVRREALQRAVKTLPAEARERLSAGKTVRVNGFRLRSGRKMS